MQINATFLYFICFQICHLGQNEDRRTVLVVRPMQLLRDLLSRVDVDAGVLLQILPEGAGNLVGFSAI